MRPYEALQFSSETFSHRGEMPNPVGPLQQGYTSDLLRCPNRAYVGGLPPDVTAVELERLFTGKGFSVRRVNIINTNRRTNYAFVTFNDTSQPEAAMILAQNDGFYLHNRRLTVSLAYRRRTPTHNPRLDFMPAVYAQRYPADYRFANPTLFVPDTHVMLTDRGFVNSVFLMQPLRVDPWGMPAYPAHAVLPEFTTPAHAINYPRGPDYPECIFYKGQPTTPVPYLDNPWAVQLAEHIPSPSTEHIQPQ